MTKDVLLTISGMHYDMTGIPDEDGSGRMSERLWQPVMRGGVVEFIRPEACPVVRPIRRQRVKRFAPGENLCPCGQLYQEVERDGMA